MNRDNLKFALIMGLFVTSYISFTLVWVNAGFGSDFILLWLRNWFIAYLLVLPSLVFVAPAIKRKLKIK